jgi:hypothetical protein
MKKITGTLHEDQYTFSIISRSVLLRMKNISDKCCRENRHTHFTFNNFFFENPARKNVLERGKPQMIIQVSEKDCTLFLFFFLGAQCVESGVSCTDCY